MVRIIIEIDEAGAAVTSQGGEATSDAQGKQAPGTEALLAAAAVGALDVGVAPTGPPPTTGAAPPPPLRWPGRASPELTPETWPPARRRGPRSSRRLP